MNAASLNSLWSYIQGLSLTTSNRRWLAERLIEPLQEEVTIPPVLQTWDEALADLDESEKEFDSGDVVSGEEFNTRCVSLIESFAKKACK